MATDDLATAPLETFGGPAFEVSRAAPAGAPPPTALVFASPHSGDIYPEDMTSAARLPVASIAMARLRLEDVFLRLVSADAHSPDDERAIRDNLQGVAEEGALA